MNEHPPLKALLEVDHYQDRDGLRIFCNKYHRENFRQSLFGGQVLAQALMAASQTVDKRSPHSMHAYFLRAGSSDEPIYYEVESIRDGRSISSRRVVAMQKDRAIFHLSASYHQHEDGYTHQDSFPRDVPSPEDLAAKIPNAGRIPEYKSDDPSQAFSMLPIPQDAFTSTERLAPQACFWLKVNSQLPSEIEYQSAALAYMSDLGLLATAVLPHPSSLFEPSLTAASIDHAMWFHSDVFNLSDWVLCQTHSPWAGHARGFATSSIFNREGRLIASTAQEGLIRPAEMA